MKNVSSFLLSLLLVASSVTSCILISHSDKKSQDVFSITQDDLIDGPILTVSEIKLGFENLTRSFQNVVIPFSKIDDSSYMELLKKFHSSFTEVSFKYLYFLHQFQSGEVHLFLNLRKLLI